MKVLRISVTKLFGMFERHTIELRTDKRITIIFGPNGIGKTIILNMIDGLFNANYSVFKIPFEEFIIDFDNGSRIRIVQKSEPDQPLSCIYGELGIGERSFPLIDIDNQDIRDLQRRLLPYLTNRIPGLEYQGNNTWQYPTGEILSSIELTERLRGGPVPDKALADLAKLSQAGPDWFAEIQKSFPRTRLIRTQRLSRLIPVESSGYSRQSTGKTEIPTVKVYSEELAKKMSAMYDEYGAISQKLESTFPSRVFDYVTPTDSLAMYDELRRQLEILSQKRANLQAVGLVEGEELKIPERIEDDNRRNFFNGVLAVYVKDAHDKLRIFDDLARRIELFKRNINSRFSFKQLKVTKNEGFVFETPSGNRLLPTDLSSGEQHELVLNYELLFKIDPHSLILIDEPELSLHIAWQQQFLDDLLETTDIGNFQVVVATHSPDIIHDHWDLTVDLGESAT